LFGIKNLEKSIEKKKIYNQNQPQKKKKKKNKFEGGRKQG